MERHYFLGTTDLVARMAAHRAAMTRPEPLFDQPLFDQSLVNRLRAGLDPTADPVGSQPASAETPDRATPEG